MISSLIPEKFEGDFFPVTLADVETMGFPNFLIRAEEKSSLVILIPIVPSMGIRFLARFLAPG